MWMSSTPTNAGIAVPALVVSRARLWFAAAVVWAALVLVLGHVFPARAHGQPVVLISGMVPFYTAPLFVVVTLGATLVGLLVAGEPSARRAVLIAAWGVGLWAAFGGTMDAWLADQNITPGAPRGGPYWLLFPDLVVATATFAGVALLGTRLGAERQVANAPEWRQALQQRGPGLTALAVTVLVALLASWPLMGPATAHTQRGQLIFALGVAFFLGVLATRQVLRPQALVWHWLAVPLVGVIGLAVAGLQPAFVLPSGYDQHDVLPAWWAARALPVELLCIGLIGVSWSNTPRRPAR
jgi:hypothetical protein